METRDRGVAKEGETFMKCAIVLADTLRQIMLSAETEMEKAVLKLIGEDNQDITVEFKRGTFFDDHSMPASAQGYCVSESRGGYLRAYAQQDALMLVLRHKEPERPSEVVTTLLTEGMEGL